MDTNIKKYNIIINNEIVYTGYAKNGNDFLSEFLSDCKMKNNRLKAPLTITIKLDKD